MVQSSVSYTLTFGSPYYVKLGLSTISANLSLNYNYSQQYCPSAINLQQNINYNYYLKDISGYPYYFVFNTGGNGQINKYTGTFIRIA